MKNATPGTYLSVVDREVEMVKCMVSRPIDNLFQEMASDHVRIVYLKEMQLV